METGPLPWPGSEAVDMLDASGAIHSQLKESLRSGSESTRHPMTMSRASAGSGMSTEEKTDMALAVSGTETRDSGYDRCHRPSDGAL